MADALSDAHARLEQALTEALEKVTAVGTPAEIERFVSLLIKHKIVTEMLYDAIQAGRIYAQTDSIAEHFNEDSGADPAIEAAANEANAGPKK